jgi:di/tricarboxylate transporter
MTPDAIFVLALLGVLIFLFVSEWLRLDVVAILAVLALMLSGQLSADEALAGFGDPVVILIAALFVVGESLYRTGVAHAVGNWLIGVSGSDETRLLVLLMATVALLSAFMSSTGAVAVFIPVVLGLAAKASIPPGRLLMPLAFASLIGGMLTLIGTPPNLIVNAQLHREGLAGFGFFDFTPIGLLVLLAGIAFMVLIGRRLLPANTATSTRPQRVSGFELVQAHALQGRFFRARLTQESPLAGKSIQDSLLRAHYRVTVVGVEREQGRNPVPALATTLLRGGDVMLVSGAAEDVNAMVAREHLELLPIEQRARDRAKKELGIVETLIAPDSRLIGKTVKEVSFRSRYGLSVLAISRRGERLDDPINEIKLEFGDVLVLGGGWDQIAALEQTPGDLLVMRMPAEIEEVAPARRKASWALLVTAGMLLLLTLQLVPSVAAVLIAALAMVLAGCVSMADAYRAINWQSLVLIAGMIPMATALERSGGVGLIVDSLMTAVGGLGPMALLAALFVLTSVLSQVISNTAATVLIAPIAIASAQGMGVSPYPLLIGVAIAASTAFATPVASPVNTLVLGPGNYRFSDFIKVGVPMQVVAMVVALLAIPVIFPF